MARESWTDERLDDLQTGMNQRFDRVETTMKEGFARVETTMKEGFARVEGELGELRGDIKAMQRLMVQGFLAICTIMVTGLFALAGLTGF